MKLIDIQNGQNILDLTDKEIVDYLINHEESLLLVGVEDDDEKEKKK